MRNYQIVIFGLIITLAAFLRLYRLDQVPPSPSLDEVSIGYNAFSILETGRDEYGYRYPLILRAYDDWRPAFYVYLVVPVVKLIGLTPLAVRIPSAVLSLMTIVLTYLMATELWRQVSAGKNENPLVGRVVPIAAAAFLAISPWHVYISRLGHEANLGLTMVVLSVYLFIRASRGCPKYLIPAALMFALSLNSYQSIKIVSPVLGIVLVVLYRKILIIHKRIAVVSAIIGLAIALPIVRASLTEESLTRLRGTSVLVNHPDITLGWEQYAEARAHGDLTGTVLNHKYVLSGVVLLKQYLTHFDPVWLTVGNAKEDFKAPYMGLEYPWLIPIMALGCISLVRAGKRARIVLVLLVSWILVSVIPASITTGVPHAMRAYTVIPAIQLLAAFGLAALLPPTFRLSSHGNVPLVGGMVVYGISAAVFGYRYFTLFPLYHSRSFQYALNQAMVDLVSTSNSVDTVIVSNSGAGYQSYMFYLFAAKYDPGEYQSGGGTSSGGYDQVHRIGTVRFEPVRFPDEQQSGSILYFGNPEDFPGDTVHSREYRYLDGTVGLVAVRR